MALLLDPWYYPLTYDPEHPPMDVYGHFYTFCCTSSVSTPGDGKVSSLLVFLQICLLSFSCTFIFSGLMNIFVRDNLQLTICFHSVRTWGWNMYGSIVCYVWTFDLTCLNQVVLFLSVCSLPNTILWGLRGFLALKFITLSDSFLEAVLYCYPLALEYNSRWHVLPSSFSSS